MAKNYTFPAQGASDELPAVPKSVTVYGESLGDATQKLGAALKEDPRLENEHPEFKKQSPETAPVESKRPVKKAGK
jgi:hypothetical protein